MNTFDMQLYKPKTQEPILPNIEVLLFSSAVLNTIQRCAGDKHLDLDSFMKFSFNETLVKNLPALGVDKDVGMKLLKDLYRSYQWSVRDIANTALVDQIQTKENFFIACIVDAAYSLCESIEIVKESFDTRDIYTKELLYKAVVEIKHNGDSWHIITTDGQTSMATDYFVNGIKRPILSRNASQVLSFFKLVASAVSRNAMRRRAVNRLKNDKNVAARAEHVMQILGGSYESILALTAELSRCKYIDSKPLRDMLVKTYGCTPDEALSVIDVFKYPDFFV